MNGIKKRHTSMITNVIYAIICILALFGVIVCIIGYISFTDAFKNEYAETTYHMADTATALVVGDHIGDYLNGEFPEEYQESRHFLNEYCLKMNVSLIYVIKVDTSDYGRFVSVFNAVNNAVDNSTYEEWELGFRRDTTNAEYRAKYRSVYEEKEPYETVYRLNPGGGRHSHITTIVPVWDSNGNVAALLCVERPISEMQRLIAPYMIVIFLSTLFLAVFASYLAAYYIHSRVGAPLNALSKETARFAKENTIGDDLSSISDFEEITGLADSIHQMETSIVKYIEFQAAVTTERERIGAELNLASNIQQKSLPNVYPAFPDRTEFDIYGLMDPAKEVGGDFYNFFMNDDDHLILAIGDVSGKGVPAALFMMETNILISYRGFTEKGETPGDALTFINKHISDYNSEDMFVSIWLASIEISTGRVIASNAGHEEIVICRKGGEFELYKTKHDIVVAAVRDVEYSDYEFRLGEGDKLFVYTDGLLEATNVNEEMFGMNRMLDALNEAKEKTPQEILENMQRRVEEFVGDAPQFDDLTMVCFELRKDRSRS